MELNLADLFEAVADTVPGAEALVCRGGGEPAVRLTYAELDERATRLAHVLARHGVGPGDRVALDLYNGNEYVEGMIAAFKLRALPVNVNYRYVTGELCHLLDDSGAVVLIHDAALTAVVDEIRPRLPRLRATIVRGAAYEAALAAASPARDFGPRSADDLYVLYTGGTTGRPKGVLWRHEDLFYGALQGGNPGGPPITAPQQIIERARAGRRRILPASPLMHGSAHWIALTTLLTGNTVVVSREQHLDPALLWQLVVDEQVSFLVVVGDAFAQPLADALEAEPRRWNLSTLTVLLSGGALLSPAVKRRLVALLPSTLVVDGIGASETGGQGQRVVTGDDDGDARFTVNDQTAVLDDDLRPLPPGTGEVGWLARRGHIPIGYHNDPDATARTFPVVDGVRWAVPGDRATVEADGTIVVLGRGSSSISSGGEKVFPEEVEAVLKGHPAVLDAVVVGVPDERWGERVAAVVQPRPGLAPDLDDLAAYARAHVAGYKVPRHLVLVEHLSRSPSGKPDYRWARAVAQTGTNRR